MDGNEMRRVLLEVVNSYAASGNIQSRTVVNEAAQRLNLGRSLEVQQALLTFWGDLFRAGYLAWGYDLNNMEPPFCHLTERGRRVLKNLSRDPANPNGYLAHLSSIAVLNPVSSSYLREGLETFNAGSFKSAAVMVGAASESLVLELRDSIAAKYGGAVGAPPQKLVDWRVKTILDAIEDLLTKRKKLIPAKIYERFESYWPAFTQQIRSVRNEAGHPVSVDPIDEPTVHAALLIFPEVARTAAELKGWVQQSFVP